MDSAPPPPDPIAATAAAQAAAALLDDALLFDLEATPDGRILAIGAEFRGQCFLREGRLQVGAVLAELAGFAHGARLVLGHNLLDHDWPLLRAQAPQAGLLRLPVLDTLYLSPLAFPENPYHALVKDYKLVRDSVNDPVADARPAVFRAGPGNRTGDRRTGFRRGERVFAGQRAGAFPCPTREHQQLYRDGAVHRRSR